MPVNIYIITHFICVSHKSLVVSFLRISFSFPPAWQQIAPFTFNGDVSIQAAGIEDLV